MSSIVQFDTIEDIKQFKTNLQTLKMQKFQFDIVTLNKLAVLLILDKIHQKMRAAGFSERIIENTTVLRVERRSKNKVRIHFRSELFADTGYDIALGREEGTDRHFIEPLSIGTPFIDKPEALHGGSNWPYFSKGHWVDGIPALHIIKDTVQEMKEPFQDEYNRALNNWYAENLKGVSA